MNSQRIGRGGRGTRPKDGDERGSKKGQLENGREGNHVGPYYTL